MTHAELQAALASASIEVDASEAHGWLAGALSARAGYSATDWLADLAGDPRESPAEPDPALAGLPAETLAAMRTDEFEFAPLLPEEDAPLSDRVAALAAWAGGYLYGIGAGEAGPAIAAAPDVGEFLRDLAEVARAGLEPGGGGDAGERDFMELTEFVRAGAQLAFEELSAAGTDAPG